MCYYFSAANESKPVVYVCVCVCFQQMSFPYEWQPSVVSTHLATVGDVAIACVPGEFTTMAGRRLRDTLQEAFRFASDKQVLISGLCNSYSDYVVTPQEYNVS